MLAEHVDQLGQIILFGQPATLGEWGGMVVTGCLVGSLAIVELACPETEVGSAVPHVIVVLTAATENLKGVPCRFDSSARGEVIVSPGFMPSRPELRYQQRGVGLVQASSFETLDNIFKSVAAVDGFGHCGFGKVVATDDGYIKSAAPKKLADECQVIEAIRHGGHQVLILVLDENDIPAVRDLVFG